MDKGKKKATEDYSWQQDIQEAEDCLNKVLRQLDNLGYNHGLVRAAVDTDTTQLLVEFLLRRINVLRGEVRAVQHVQEQAEQDVRRAREELRRRDDSSHYTTEDEEHRRKTPRLQEGNHPVYAQHGLRAPPLRQISSSSSWDRSE